MNYDAIRAHERLLQSELPRRTHERRIEVIPQGGRVPKPMKAQVRKLLKRMNVNQVASLTGLHRKTVARIRDGS